jgi:hypothetical protein
MDLRLMSLSTEGGESGVPPAELTPGVESRADLFFKDQDGGIIDVTSASGLSRVRKTP